MVRRSEIARANAAKRLDDELNDAQLSYAKRRFGDRWITEAVTRFSFDDMPEVIEEEVELFGVWALYHMPVTDIDPMPLAWRYCETQRLHREPAKDRLIEAQLNAPIGIWEVQSVERGIGSQMKELLTGRERFIYDAASSQTLSPGLSLLGYVVDVDGISFFAGIHTRPLLPAETAAVVREIRKLARVRTRPVPDDFLADSDRQLDVVDHWRMAIEMGEDAFDRMQMNLQNTMGEAISFQTDHFDLVGPRDVVLRRLAAVPGAQPAERDGSRDVITVLDTRDGDATGPGSSFLAGMTIAGQIILAGKTLTIESNSVTRADVLRSAVEDAVGIAVRYRVRSSESLDAVRERAKGRISGAPPLTAKPGSGKPGSAKPGSGNPKSGMPKFGKPAKVPPGKTSPGKVFTSMDDMPPEVLAAVQQMMAKIDARWLDVPVPALGNATPRAASQDPKLKPKLIALLKDMEARQALRADGNGMDIAKIRRDLGL